jgi:hypothetical protein
MITIKTKNGKKEINGRNFENAIKDFNENDVEYNIIKQVFNNINSENDLVNEFVKVKISISKASILLCLKTVTNSSISEVYPIFDRIFEDDNLSLT